MEKSFIKTFLRKKQLDRLIGSFPKFSLIYKLLNGGLSNTMNYNIFSLDHHTAENLNHNNNSGVCECLRYFFIYTGYGETKAGSLRQSQTAGD